MFDSSEDIPSIEMIEYAMNILTGVREKIREAYQQEQRSNSFSPDICEGLLQGSSIVSAEQARLRELSDRVA